MTFSFNQKLVNKLQNFEIFFRICGDLSQLLTQLSNELLKSPINVYSILIYFLCFKQSFYLTPLEDLSPLKYQQIRVFRIIIIMKLDRQNKSQSFLLEFSFGGISAFISKTVASPIEVVKLRLQVQYALIEKGLITSQYEGISDCFRKLYIENGLTAFFRGNGTNSLRFFLTQALNFSFRDLFRSLQQDQLGLGKDNLSFAQNILAGGAAGASTQFIVYPLDYARTRLANQVKLSDSTKTTHYKGLIDCIFKTYYSDGILGIYRGFSISCLCMIFYRGFYFGIYDSLRPLIPKHEEENMIITFSLGYLATIASGSISYPLDTVRRRMMMTSGENTKFTSSVHCIQKIHSEGGWRAFFRGGAANIIGGLTGAAVLSIYDRLKVYYQKRFQL